MRRFLFLLLAPLALFGGEDKDPNRYSGVANLEGIPSAYIEGCVNVITGDFCLHETDMVLPGPEPLTLERSFISSDNDYGSLCHSWNLNHHGKLHVYKKMEKIWNNSLSHRFGEISEALGSKIRLAAKPTGNWEVWDQTMKVDEKMFGHGMTNTGYGEISGRTNIKNNRLVFDRSFRFCTLKTSEGDQHVYRITKDKFSELDYRIHEKRRPFLLKHLYGYHADGKISRLLLTDNGTHHLSSLQFGAWKFQPAITQEIVGSDGQQVCYHFINEDHNKKKKCYFITKVEKTAGPTIKYTYEKYKFPYRGECFRLTSRKLPDNRYLNVRYYNHMEKKNAKEEIKKEEERRRREGKESYFTSNEYFTKGAQVNRVAALRGPIGPDGSEKIIYRFNYHLNPAKKGGVTEVYDALDRLTEYSYSNGRLDKIVRHLDKKPYSRQRLYWGNDGILKGNLLTQTWESKEGWIQACRHFSYDERGNILKEALLGNITGANSVPVILDKAVPKYNGAERYVKQFTYTTENQLLTETDLLKRVEYRYLPGTDKVTAKFTLSKGKIVKREFFKYSMQGVLIEEIVDDGSTKEYSNLSGVTERHIKVIGLTEGIPWCLPDSEYRYAFNLETGEKIYLGHTKYYYSKRGFLTCRALYDAQKKCVQVRHWEYDSHGNVVSERDPRGNTILRRYDANDNLLFEQGPHPGLKKHFRYDYMNRLIQKQEILEDGTGISTFYRYDLLGNKTAEIDIYGNETRFEYDGLNRLVRVSRKEREERYQYDCLGYRTFTTDGEGRRTQRVNTIRGAPFIESYADGGSQKWRYNLDGSVLDHTDRTGLRTRYRYDWAGRPVEKQFFSAEGDLLYTTTATYNAFHLIAETDAMGVETRYQYDFAGRLVRKTKEGSETLYAYDAQGRECRTTFVDDNASFTLFKEYDDLGQLLEERIEDGEGNLQQATRYEYDSFGNRSACLTGGSATLTEYDALGRPLLVTDAEGNSSRFIYRYDYKNEKGEKVACEECIDPKGRVTRTVKDIHGNSALIEKINSYGKTLQKTRFLYDRCGRKTRRIDSVIVGGKKERESAAEWEYDLVGRVVKMRQAAGTPEQKTVRIAYNRFGQKERLIKADGTEIQYSYDKLGRLSDYRSSDGSIAYSYHYDLCGNPLSVTDEIAKEQTLREYDLEGRITRETLANGLSMEYLYDRIGRVVKARLPDGSGYSVGYRGKKLSKISRIDPAGKERYSHSYLEHDPETGRLLEAQMAGEAGRLSFEYDIMGRVQSVISDHWREVIAGFDETGNLLQKEIRDAKGVQSCSYCYDDLDQLVSESGPVSHSYRYDSLNNRLEKDAFQNSVSLLNQPLRTKEGEYRYDDNGNRIEKKSGGAVATYRYDALDRLVSIESEEGRVDYRYDPFNRRIARTLDGVEERFLYQRQNEIGLFNEEGEALELRLLGSGLGAEIGAAVAIELKGGVYAPVHDHNGNLSLLLDSATGKVAERYRYDAFGCEIPEELSYIERIYRALFGEMELNNPWRFSGKRLDAESGLIYFGRRYYDPQSATWSSQDPLGDRDGPNLYAYVHNNPLTHFDLYGLLDREPYWKQLSGLYHTQRRALGAGIEGFAQHAMLPGDKRYAMEAVGRAIQFKTPRLRPSWTDKPAFGFVGEGKVVLAIYSTGILNTKEECIEHAERYSKKLGGGRIGYAYSPTQGALTDAMVAGLYKCNVSQSYVKKYAKFVEKCYNINAEHMENPLINICGNSRAAEEMYQSFKYQNKEVLSHTMAFTFGGYKMLSRRDGLEAAFNHVNPDDPVSKMCGRYHMSEYQDEIFHTDYRSSGPFKHLDAHLLMSPGYQKAEDDSIMRIKDEFSKRGVAL